MSSDKESEAVSYPAPAYTQGGYIQSGYLQGGYPLDSYPRGDYPAQPGGEYLLDGQTGYAGNPGNVNVVTAPPEMSTVVQQFIKPRDYYCLSILSIFFCWPIAICAVSHSNRSRTAASVGNYEEARQQGVAARNLAIGAIVTGIITTVVLVVVELKVGLFTSAKTYDYKN